MKENNICQRKFGFQTGNPTLVSKVWSSKSYLVAKNVYCWEGRLYCISDYFYVKLY